MAEGKATGVARLRQGRRGLGIVLMVRPMAKDDNPQLDKFKEAARELEADEDEKRWDERLKKVAGACPKTSPPREES